ncbi:SDR family oxidoreductase [Nodosilinea nodulosa]|uniref:SDR family oxidoreductase n=1 Tax=Nodosilinea nodulosa TaxID=416001 RepID=UPI0002E08127
MTSSKPEVVVITGSSAGIGRATAQAFAKQGAHIGLLARSRAGLEAAQREVEALGGKALVLPTDMSDPDQVESAAAAVEATLGPIDIWVNNAMASILSPFTDIAPADFRRVTEVTYLGYVYGTMSALRRMKPRDRGTIVQVGSALAYRSIPLQSAYCGAKSAIRGFTDSIRCELLHDHSNVHITMVQMPAVNTPQFNWIKTTMTHQPQPVPPIFQPEVAAEAIVWSAHHDRRELFVGGSTVEAIWGTKLAPGLLDRYLASSGYSGQQTDQPIAADRRSNLWEPLPPDSYSAHGQFDDQAQADSLELTVAQRLNWKTLALGVGIVGLAGVAVAAQLGGDRHGSQSTEQDNDGAISEREVQAGVLRRIAEGGDREGPPLFDLRHQLLLGMASMAWRAVRD